MTIRNRGASPRRKSVAPQCAEGAGPRRVLTGTHHPAQGPPISGETRTSPQARLATGAAASSVEEHSTLDPYQDGMGGLTECRAEITMLFHRISVLSVDIDDAFGYRPFLPQLPPTHPRNKRRCSYYLALLERVTLLLLKTCELWRVAWAAQPLEGEGRGRRPSDAEQGKHREGERKETAHNQIATRQKEERPSLQQSLASNSSVQLGSFSTDLVKSE